MDISLSHHFDRPIDDVWGMLSDPDSHIAKFTSMGHRDIEVLASENSDDSFDLTLVRQVDIEVPSVARKFLKPTNTVASTDHWERSADGSCAGRYSADLKGVPVESGGTTTLVVDGDGCKYTINLSVKVKVPIVGEKVAGALRPQLERQVSAEFDAGEAWLATH